MNTTWSFSEQTERQQVLGTAYTPVLSHPSGNFVPGEKYWLVVHGLLDLPVGATDHIRARVTHGGVPFDESGFVLEPTNAAKRYNYTWFTVWTAVADEAITLEMSCSDPLAFVGGDLLTIFARRLTPELVEGVDWLFTHLTPNDALTTSPVSSASVQFTPTVSTDWLVMSSAQLSVSSLTVNYASELGPAGTYTNLAPIYSREGEDVAELLLATNVRVFQELGAQLQTFAERSYSIGAASGTRKHSSVFALNLNKFRTRASLWVEQEEELSTTLWDDLLGSLTIVPEVTGDVYMLVAGTFLPKVSGAEITHRLTVNEVDAPPGQTLDQYVEEEPADPIDTLNVFRQTLQPSVSLATMAWEAEASLSSGPPGVRDRVMVAFTMELGGNVPSVATVPYEAVGYVQAHAHVPYEIAP